MLFLLEVENGADAVCLFLVSDIGIVHDGIHLKLQVQLLSPPVP